MQWQRTGRCLQTKSVGECLKRHSEQQLTDQTMYVFIFWPWFSSLALAQLVLAALVVSESPLMLAKPCAWGSPSWNTHGLWIALSSLLNSHECPGTLSHIKMFLSCVRKRERSGIASGHLYCVIEELLQHDRFFHLYVFCMIPLGQSCHLFPFTNEEYSRTVWLKLQLPGILCSKPNEDLATVMSLVWHLGRCSLLLLSLWQLLTTVYMLYIWLVFQKVWIFGLKFKPGTKGLCGLPSALTGLKQC